MHLPSRPMATWRTLDEAAVQVGVSRRTLQRWIAERRIHAYRIAGDRRAWVDLDEVHELRTPRPRRPGPEAAPAETGLTGLTGEVLAEIESTEPKGEATEEGG
jgi:excisionase family DNA binding protein